MRIPESPAMERFMRISNCTCVRSAWSRRFRSTARWSSVELAMSAAYARNSSPEIAATTP